MKSKILSFILAIVILTQLFTVFSISAMAEFVPPDPQRDMKKHDEKYGYDDPLDDLRRYPYEGTTLSAGDIWICVGTVVVAAGDITFFIVKKKKAGTKDTNSKD